MVSIRRISCLCCAAFMRFTSIRRETGAWLNNNKTPHDFPVGPRTPIRTVSGPKYPPASVDRTTPIEFERMHAHISGPNTHTHAPKHYALKTELTTAYTHTCEQNQHTPNNNNKKHAPEKTHTHAHTHEPPALTGPLALARTIRKKRTSRKPVGAASARAQREDVSKQNEFYACSGVRPSQCVCVCVCTSVCVCACARKCAHWRNVDEISMKIKLSEVNVTARAPEYECVYVCLCVRLP